MNNYLDNGKSFLWGNLDEPLNPGKLKLLDNNAIGKVLDVGCAVGRYSNYLQIKGLHVTGVDSQKEFIAKAVKSYKDCEFKVGSAYKLPFKDNSFDTIILFDILEHLDDERVLMEARRVGRRVIISVPHKNQDFLTSHSLAHHHYMDMTHIRTYTPNSLRKVLSKNRFKVTSCHSDLPISIHALALDYFSNGVLFKRILLKIILKLFPNNKVYNSAVFAVAEKI